MVIEGRRRLQCCSCTSLITFFTEMTTTTLASKLTHPYTH